jgi:DNA adenine methylase
MKKNISPLRYPGGKSRLSDFMEDLILLNNLENQTIYEMYAGGAGASLNLLFAGITSNIVLNDLDYHIYAFWYSILNHTNEFIQLIENTEVNLVSWNNQKLIHESYNDYSILEVGFSSFFLNRSNRSGVFSAGPIGGKNQTGNYKIDVRFNKIDLIDRIIQIADKKENIRLTNLESIQFLKEIFQFENQEHFIFLDPPYYVQGENLYFNFYTDENHLALSNLLRENNNHNWFLTYDNSDRIKELYDGCKTAYLPMTYTLETKRKSKEIMVFSDSLHIPKSLRIGKKTSPISLITI